jgi:hypothetical protein
MNKILLIFLLFPLFIQAQPKSMPHLVSNCCFINSSLQALAALKSFTKTVTEEKKYQLNGFADLYSKMLNGQLSKDLTIQLYKKSWNAIQKPIATPQDAQEFIQKFFENLFFENKKLEKLFSISINTTIVDFANSDSITRNSKELMLPLFLREDHKTLQDSLADFFSNESIERNSFYSIKKVSLDNASEYFVMYLNRALHNANQKKSHKLQKNIAFPLTLNLEDFSEKMLPQYNLTSVIMHSGDSNGGHYSAYVKYGDSWYFCNDAIIQPVSKEMMSSIARRGYGTDKSHLPQIFFYQKI